MPQDYAQAALWYRKAAEQGDDIAQYSLGTLYYNGQGLPQDYTQALTWYRKAAEQGYAEAEVQLGRSYYKGQGVPQDYAEAYFWLDLAAAGKLDDSETEGAVARLRDNIASHMTPADLSREQERARKWYEERKAKTQ